MPEPMYTLLLRGVPMRQALEELARTTKMDLVYSTSLVSDKEVYCDGRNAAPEGLLRCILKDSGLDFIRSSSGAYVLISSPEQAPRYGYLSGSVVDGTTGEPLPYAHVMLADAAAGTTTDAAGLFSFATVLSGMQRVVVTYVGYETVVDSIRIAQGATGQLQLALRPHKVAMEPVIIDGLSQRQPSASLGLGALHQGELQAPTATGTPDVARGAATVMGVATQQPLADLHIQGGASGEHLTLLDGVPVRDPVSLGRHLGAFSPLALRRLTVHKAGFGAEAGSHLSGVIAVEQDVVGAEEQEMVLQVDPVSINGKVQGRFRLSEGLHGAAMVAVRSSVWDVYEDTGVSSLLRRWNTVDPLLASYWVGEAVTSTSLDYHLRQPAVAFSDVHASARLHLSPFRILHASLYRARNRLASDLVAVSMGTDVDQLLLKRDEYDWANWAGQVQHHWLLGARSMGTLQVQASRHASHYLYGAARLDTFMLTTPEAVQQAAAEAWPAFSEGGGYGERNRIREVAVKASVRHSLSVRQQVEAGIAVAQTGSRFWWGNQYIAPFRHATTAWDLTSYLKSEWAIRPQTTWEPSLRLTYLPVRGMVYAEPRMAIRYDRAASAVGPYALRIAGGLYRQFTNQFDISSSGASAVVPSLLFWLPLDASIAPPRAYHLATEALFTPGSAWTINLEGYLKWQPRLLTLDYAALLEEHPARPSTTDPVVMVQSDFVSATRGRAYGGGVRVQWAGERLTTTFNYSYSHAVQQFPSRFDGRYEPVPWNDPHRLSVDARWLLSSRLTAGFTGRSSWGRGWALRRAYYDYLALRTEPTTLDDFDLHRPGEQKLEPYFRLDAGLTYEQHWGRAGVQMRVFVSNLLDRRNTYDWSIERGEASETIIPRLLPGRHAGLSLRFDY